MDARFPRQPPVEDLFRLIDARRDAWVGERDFEEIHRYLETVKSDLRAGKATFAPLDRERRRLARLELAELKIVSSERASDRDPLPRTRLRVELGGRGPQGARVSLQGYWTLAWRRRGPGWVPAVISAAPLRAVRSPLRFTDITEGALGANPSWQQQLRTSTDEWRARLDAAAGIDVYGHNGLAVGDYDGDGLEDIYVCQPAGLPNRLFRNNGNRTFTDVTAVAGVDLLDDTRSAYFADIDNDGDEDLIAITASQPVLMRNDGRGRFTPDLDALPSQAHNANSFTSAALADYDNDGYLDLYVCAYDFWRPGRTYNAPTPYHDANNGPPNLLFRNRGGRRFEEVTARSGPGGRPLEHNARYSFAAAWGDYDQDGRLDLYVANDFGRNNLYHNNGDGTFTDVAARAGVEDIGAGMSAAWGDYDGDGDLDLYVGNMWSSAGQRLTGNLQFGSVAAGAARAAFQRHARGNSLFRNNGDGTFSDVTVAAGVDMGRWAWSSGWADLDSDGRLDLYVQNGYISGAMKPDL